MRARPTASLSLVVLSAVLLAGCAGTPDAAETPSGAPTDLCAAAAQPGAGSDGVEVEGEVGSAPTATFEAPLDVTEVERTVISEGDGDPIAEGDYISYALTAYDANTGDQLGTLGYQDGELLPQPVATDSALGAFFGCATVGSRVVTTLPPSENSANATVYVLDLQDVVPTAAWGAEAAPAAGLPSVELAEDGEPTVTIPDAEAPTEVQLGALKTGDGPVVESGDTVLVQYEGVKWSDGTEFDSSWGRGTPASFATTGVVDGFRQALEGQTVGSQVVVVVPPAAGYGASEGNELQNETLVFVVDILATQHPTAP